MIAATGCKSCPSGQYGSGAAVGQRINEGDACDKCITGNKMESHPSTLPGLTHKYYYLYF